jgi:peptidoglycan/LPS O-acetylase OafA/YrhL
MSNMNNPEIVRPKRINELESLRGILALWVVVSHILPSAGILEEALGPFKFLAKGDNAVDVFIIMSGFFIFFLLDSAQEKYGQFIIRRFLRLFPAYLVCLIISILMVNVSLEVLHNLAWQHPQNDFRIQVFNDSLQHFIPQLLAHLTILHGLVPDSLLSNSQFAFIGQAWSISLEWQFYLVAPFLFYAIHKKKPVLTFFLLGISCLSYYLFKSAAQGFLFTQIPFFFLGILSFYIWKNYPSIVSFSDQQWALVMPVGVVLTLLFTHEIPTTLWVLVFLSILSLQENGKLVLENIVCRLLNNRVMLYLGRISYSMYLCHVIVMYGVMYCLERFFPELQQLHYLALLLVLVLSLTILFAHLIYYSVEKPFIKLGKGMFVTQSILDSSSNKNIAK